MESPFVPPSNIRHELELGPFRHRMTVELAVPPEPRGLVVLAHDACSELRPRNVALAWCLQRGAFATVAVSEGLPARLGSAASHGRLLVSIARWALDERACAGLRVGLVGLGRGVPGALAAAALAPALVKTLVVFDGAAALERHPLSQVRAPTLLLASRGDPASLRAGVGALGQLPRGSGLSIIDEADALETLVELVSQTRGWLNQTLAAGRRPDRAASASA